MIFIVVIMYTLLPAHSFIALGFSKGLLRCSPWKKINDMGVSPPQVVKVASVREKEIII